MWKDLLFGLRMHLKTPAVTLAVVLTLACGIAGNSIAFSLVNTFFLRPLPVDRPQGLVRIYTSYDGGQQYFTVSYPDYTDIAEMRDVFTGVLADMPVPVSLRTAGSNERLWGSRVSRNYFSVLGVKPALGRSFSTEEDGVVMLSYDLWRQRFHGRAAVLGETAVLNGRPFQVIGVAPEYFHGVNLGVTPELYLPAAIGSDRGARGYFLLGRTARGIGIRQSMAALDLLSRRLQQQFPRSNQGIHFTALPESEGRVHPMARGGVMASRPWWPRWPRCFCCSPAPTWRQSCWCVRRRGGKRSACGWRWARHARALCGSF